MGKISIGTRESQLAVWQATQVQHLLAQNGVDGELVFISSEGDRDLVTPLYKIGVQGIFTRSLDTALLNHKIDLAVHSMKDVPVQLAQGIRQAAVLERGSHKDVLVLHPTLSDQTIRRIRTRVTRRVEASRSISGQPEKMVIATSSVRRMAQWLNRYPGDKMENLRGNVNTRIAKLKASNWHGAIFAAAGLERINLRPETAIDLDWMLPAPAQGAIIVVCREEDEEAFGACRPLNDEVTAVCTKIERDFLSGLMGGCSTPISALAKIDAGHVIFSGNVVSPGGEEISNIERRALWSDSADIGFAAARDILASGGQALIDSLNATK